MPEISLVHDGKFDIATGKHRRDLQYKNKEITWLAFVKKTAKTHYTAETHAEYMKALKSRQDEIKDVGGYVGGYLRNGRRKAGHIVHRQLITLDIDFAPPRNFWDDFELAYGEAAVLYSTHKHAPTAPRYRLILPLDRPVFAEEYQAIARRIADSLGIDFFDHTTFQPIRLMYWPSTSSDGEFVFKYQDGPWLSADGILATYKDWRDSSEWPMCSREDKFVQYNIKKQGDPLEKPGIVGAWCRTYGIQEVIETTLADVYEPCDVEGRFTYREGSTAGGLVTYEDKYAYSHHGTDAISGKLCNAFDLVRLHKFGIRDDDARVDTPPNRLPSYLAMMDFCTKDPKVRKQLGVERLADAKHDFDTDVDIENIDRPENDGWLADMDVDKKGNYRSTIDNAMSILKHDPGLKGKLALNTFEMREVALKNLPWRKVTKETMYLTDKDDAGLRHYMEKMYGIAGVQKTTDALALNLAANSFHPVKAYLGGLVWDREPRLDYLLIDYLGAEDSDYIKAVTRKTLVAAVARIYNPGIKYDTVLTIIGPQGIGKSTIAKKLGREWFSDSLTTIQGKEAFEALQGVWIVEIAELSGFRHAEVDAIKHYVAKTDDRYRVAYGKRVENFPRQCIFIGTANKKNFLKDTTGGRRFWPVDCLEQKNTKSVFTDLTRYEVDQLWAEAVELLKLGETIHLDAEMEAQAAEQQESHREQDDRFGAVSHYLDTLLPGNWEAMGIYERRAFLTGEGDDFTDGTILRTRVCAAEVWCEVMGGTLKDMTVYNAKTVHDILRTMPGWEEAKTKTRFKQYGTQKMYRRTGDSTDVILNEILRKDLDDLG